MSSFLSVLWTCQLAKTDKKEWWMQGLVCMFNVLITPFLLVYWSTSIFVWPCLKNTFGTVCCRLLFLSNYIESWCIFKDPEFKTDDNNAGINAANWVRLQDIHVKSASNVKTDGTTHSKVGSLFNKVDPSDIAQGQLGDCWLLAAFSILAERPELIASCFTTLSFNPRGKYTLRLYNDKNVRQTVVIDDYIPCGGDGLPIYTQLKSDEMWPLLLEKAFAKMRGGYKSLNGGLPLDAMKTMTGFSGKHIFLSQQDDKMFGVLKKYFDSGCILACGSRGEDKTRKLGRDSVQGSVVPGHAYSILGVYAPTLSTERVRLLKLRNPWGTFEWKGDWSDSSSKWTQYPGVALTIGKPQEANDGVFYISWEDFLVHYNIVDVLFPAVSLESTHIETHEECGLVGTTVGCLLGLANFWCGLQGCYRLWAAASSKKVQAELETDSMQSIV